MPPRLPPQPGPTQRQFKKREPKKDEDDPMPDVKPKVHTATGQWVPGKQGPRPGPLPPRLPPTQRPFKKKRVNWKPDVAPKLQRQARTVAQMQRENTDLLERMRLGGEQLRARDKALMGKDIDIMLQEDDFQDSQKRVREVEKDLAEARRPRAAPRAAPAAPIITVSQSAPGGGGASSSAAGGAAAAPAAAAAPDLSQVVEAVKKIAESVQAAKKKPAGKAGKGITQARRRYTDRRKITLAALRALKSKRIREFNTKTKKLPKAERDKQRREFKRKVNSQYKEVTTKFPTARGMKSAGEVRELIKKLEGIKTGR